MKRFLRKDLPLEKQEYLRNKDKEYHHKVRKIKPDYKEAQHKHYVENQEHYYLTNKKSVLKSKYGITWGEYQEMFERQNGVCAICKKTEENRMLAVDHRHDETKKVRGLLCGS